MQRYWKGKAPVPINHSSSESSEEESVVEEQQPVTKPTYNPPAENKEESDEEDEEYQRRTLLRNRLLAQKKAPEPAPLDSANFIVDHNVSSESEQEDEEEEETSSSGTSDDDEEDEYPQRVMLKPVFVGKSSRVTIAASNNTNEQQNDLKENDRIQKRREEASNMVMDILRKEMKELEMKQAGETFDVDDQDWENDEDCFDADGNALIDPARVQQLREESLLAWKLRELYRLKRDRDARQLRLKEEEDKERRQKMTDAEIEAENEKLGKNRPAERPKMAFLQKYYHKGAFGTGDSRIEEALARTDALAPTLEDHLDKTFLPNVMQVKNFGKKSRTKYTHLADQDTTKYGRDAAGWSRRDTFSTSIAKKMGGMKSEFKTRKRKAEDDQ